MGILNELKKRDKERWHFIGDLLVKVYHPERFDEREECCNYSYTRAEFVSFHRAIQSLERRGLVETTLYKSGMLNFNDGKGGACIAKKLRLV